MEYVIIGICCLVILLLLSWLFKMSVKEIKNIANNSNLNEIAAKLPDNKEICKSILKQLHNENVRIEENPESQTSLYLVMGNKISIASKKESFVRIQTIAHECIHSTQSKKMLWFNFIYSNIYLLYFIVISILTILKLVPNEMLQIGILVLMGFLYYIIRSMLETEALIKAPYVAKEYLKNNATIEKEDTQKIMREYYKINEYGVSMVNYNLIMSVLGKVIVYVIICSIFLQ